MTLSGYNFATKACIDNRKKNLLSSNVSPTCPHNMVNVGPLAAEIFSLVWGSLANFNRFHVLAVLLLSQTAALNRGRHLYSAGRPSRWALAHISSLSNFSTEKMLVSVYFELRYFCVPDAWLLCIVVHVVICNSLGLLYIFVVFLLVLI